ncbi:AsnC family transcriptional regulator [Natronomonas halophila]|uniref:winged helix-turn-helix transcriptional regulator n=1 Tax=Natronomonas halophila TaxID=2747817 RepID=UPI0015B4D0CF|nr:winged helix-turn-helix transcriptional regulator [Natronomonas halophila]QLD85386.1 AsnC family transcriptional regulator [Natronomonas halophila]
MTDSLDRRLVAALCADGRADVRSLAAETDTAATTVQDRLRALEDNGVITGYTARLDYDRLGYETAIFQLSVDQQDVDDVATRLRERPEFVTVYETSGRHTVVAVGKFGDENAIGSCLQELHADAAIRAVDIARADVVSEANCPLAPE